MARSLTEAYNYITTELQSRFTAVGITINPANWSITNRLRNITEAIAAGEVLSEQLQDEALKEIKVEYSKSVAASSKWVQSKMFEFQYSATTPQVLDFVDGVPVYSSINTLLRIITACAVQQTLSNVVKVKVAKGSPLAKLTTNERNAAQDYIDTIGVAGVDYDIISLDPDRLYIKATIYYQSVYDTTIQAAVIGAIETYLEGLSRTRFGGDLLVSEIKAFIKSINGVNDVVVETLACRTDAQSVLTGITLVDGFDELTRRYIMTAGYIIPEDTALYTFADTLTFVPE